MPRITGRLTTRRERFRHGLMGLALLLPVLLALTLSGNLNRIEYRALDWLQTGLARPDQASCDIVILYIDQKSIDFFQQARGIGWPWPRDAYGMIVQYLTQAQARAIVFDAIYSEPSVFASDFNDDQAFAEAARASGRVFQTIVLHNRLKGGTPTDPARLALLHKQNLDYHHGAGPPPPLSRDVTLPILPLAETAWGLGIINFQAEADGVVRRLNLVEALDQGFYPTLSLAVFLKSTGTNRVKRTATGLEAGSRLIPLDDDGRALIKYHGGPEAYKSYTVAAIIQSAMLLGAGQQPLLPLELFKDKIVFIGASAAGLYDLRSTPVSDALPGVLIHASFIDNLLKGDFLRPAGLIPRAGLPILLLLATVSAAILTRRILTGALATLGLAVLYSGLVMFAFRENVWLDLVGPLFGLATAFGMATLINYYGEGREKSAVRSAFSRYLSLDVVNSVLEHPELLTLGGSRRVMTVFFSDLAGFTSISEALSPEALVHLLNRYLSLMTGSIMRSGGTLDKFEGDAIMAFWGAPLPQEDHARRACFSALEQQEIMARFREEVLGEGLPELQVRMGLNTGPMIVGNMGSEERFDYTVMGDSVNLASRLEGANKPFGTLIMISEATYEQVKTEVEVRELDLLRVKGKKEPIRVFELMSKAGGLDQTRLHVREAYLQGLALYRDMDFVHAEAAFLTALEIDPKDGPSLAYLERCRTYQKNPPPIDWDRVFTMTTK